MVMKYLDLKNKIFLLTGGTGNIGKVTAKEILNLGGKLIIISSSKKNIKNFKNNLHNNLINNCEFILADLNKNEDIEFLTKKIKKNYKYLNGIINNAYSGKTGPIKNIKKNDFIQATNLNLYAPFKIIKDLKNLLIKGAMKMKNQSSIVNISSMYGMVSPNKNIYNLSKNLNPIQYGSTKAGLIQMTKYLACNLDPKKIRVNCISPGPIPINTISKNFLKKLSNQVPMNRVGKPIEVALPIIFLLTDFSSYLNGTNIPVDGGWTAW